MFGFVREQVASWRQRNFVHIVTHGIGSVILWVFLFLDGTMKLVSVYVKIDGANFRSILEKNLLEVVKDFKPG